MAPLLRTDLRTEQDVVLARQRARQIAELLGFDTLDQTRIATAVSEIARNAYRYAGGGRVEFAVLDGKAPAFEIQIQDAGQGIPHLQEVLDGQYRSETGMGIGIAGAQRLMDRFEIRSEPRQGTHVRMSKSLPTTAGVSTALVRQVGARLAQMPLAESPLVEIEQQNRELLKALGEVRQALQENERLREELNETNRGVMALYKELDENSLALQRASEAKSRFLSHMSHEFRTPLNSILSLSGFLLSRLDGDLSPEQEKQVELIRKSAQGLYELVNDLLDLAKVEAGKIQVRPTEFRAGDLLAALRGMFRPLLHPDGPALVIQDSDPSLPPLVTDEGRVSQVLRNFISNALKFTERGEVRVWVERDGPEQLRLSVRDTGIGIAEEDQRHIFDEFVQLDSPLQRRVRGTGLGLPLSRKLAELLGGRISVESTPGEGSTFALVIPARLPGSEEPLLTPAAEPSPDERPAPSSPAPQGERLALIVDDEETSRYVLREQVTPLASRTVEAQSGEEGLALARRERPDVIFLDLMMPGLSGYEVLAALKEDPELRGVPVVIVTSMSLTEADRRKLGGAAAILSKHLPTRDAGAAAIRQALVRAGLASWLKERRGADV